MYCRPFTIYYGSNTLNDVAGGSTDRVGGSAYIAGSCPDVQTCQTMIPRNTYTGDPYYDWDLRVTRTVHFNDRLTANLAFDAFNLVFSAVLIPVGITEVMAFTPQFWPHANMLLSFLLATPLVASCGLVYLYFTVMMPRSGGDYVWVSRTLSPFLGFFANFSLTFVFLTWVAFNFTYMLGTMGPAAAYVAGWHSTYLTSPSHGEMMIIATVLTAARTALILLTVAAMPSEVFAWSMP